MRLQTIRNVFFQKISASSFCLMRSAWGLTLLIYYIPKIQDSARYFSGEGVLPTTMENLILRPVLRFTILDVITEPHAVTLLFIVMLLAALCMTIGLFPRISTVISVLLLISFQERNPFPFGGGDTVLRNVGFILMIAPTLSAFSLNRLRHQWKHWKKTRTLLSPLTQSIWPRHLLLWQLVVIYVTTGWYKMYGPTWWSGTAISIVLNHETFARFPFVATILSPFSPMLGYALITFEVSWILLILPKNLFETAFLASKAHYKRFLLIIGVLLHGGIFILFNVGSFSPAMCTAYIGLLDDDDFNALRAWFNRKWRGVISVFFDGHCGLCLRSVFTLHLLDHLHRLELIDFNDTSKRMASAPDLKLEELDRAMHIRFRSTKYQARLPDGQVPSTREVPNLNEKTLKGFDAFRELCWHLPALIPVAPFLYYPGVSVIGRKIYAQIAEKRKRCTHENCHL